MSLHILSRGFFVGTLSVFSWVVAPVALVQATVLTNFPAWSAAAGPATTINFEGLISDTIITNQFASISPVGVLFSNLDGGVVQIANAAKVASETGGVPVSGVNVLDAELPDTGRIEARFVFPNTTVLTTVRSVGAWMIDIGTFGGASAQFFDINGLLIDSVSFAPVTESNVFLGAVNDLGIARVVFDGVTTGEFVLIDDFSFATPVAAVPEPTSLSLWTLGSLGLFGCRWRRQRQS